MRIHILFLIVWGLLCLTRMADLLSSLGEYRLTIHAESAFRETLLMNTQDEQALNGLAARKDAYFQRVTTATFEMLMLGGICMIFFRARRLQKMSHPSTLAQGSTPQSSPPC
jgi:hypothetical protein